MENTIEKNTFYIIRQHDLHEVEIKQKFEFLGRTFIVHKEEYQDEWHVSDYITGMLFFSHKAKATAIKTAKAKLGKKPDYDFSRHLSINTPQFLKGYNKVWNSIAMDDCLERQGAMRAIKEIYKTYNP